MKIYLAIFISGFLSLSGFTEEKWTPSVDYAEVIKRAKSGSHYFQGLLGIYLRSGEAGSTVNLNLSRQWSELASKNNHPFGTYNLANLSMLKGDFEKATQYYQDAALLLQRQASSGDPIAMYCMGEIDFQVIPTNIPRALEWFRKSAELNYPQAQATLGALYLKGLPGLLPKNTKVGIEMLAKAVRAKSLTARFNLGMAYLHGDGVPKSALKAIQWLKVAEGQNFAEAQYTLGILLLEGEDGVKKNTIEGLQYLKKASSQNHQLAIRYLEKREGKASNITERHKPSVHVSNDEDMLSLAKKLYTGVGSDRDYERAYSIFLPLAQGGNAEAARYVGIMKFAGRGSEKSIKEARQWLSVAAQKGDEAAMQMLEKYRSLLQ
jgi:TPR repeat protein